HTGVDGVECLEAVSGVEHDRLGLRVELALVDQLAQDAGGDTAGRLGENALGTRQAVDGVDDFVVAHVCDGASGALCDVEHVGTVGRVADRQGLGDGVRFDRLYGVVPVLPRLGDRGAARGLGTEDLVRTVLDQ